MELKQNEIGSYVFENDEEVVEFVNSVSNIHALHKACVAVYVRQTFSYHITDEEIERCCCDEPWPNGTDGCRELADEIVLWRRRISNNAPEVKRLSLLAANLYMKRMRFKSGTHNHHIAWSIADAVRQSYLSVPEASAFAGMLESRCDVEILK